MSIRVPSLREHEALQDRVKVLEDAVFGTVEVPPEPIPFERPVLLYTDAYLNEVKDALKDPNSVQSMQWAKAVGSSRLSPDYQPKTNVSVINSLSNQEPFIQDSQAVHALALRWRLEDNEGCAQAALRVIHHVATTVSFINSNYDGAEGKLVASWAFPNYANGMAILWNHPSVDDELRWLWRNWLLTVALDGHTDQTQRGGNITFPPTGEIIRGKDSNQPLMNAGNQVGGSLLDFTGGANWQVGFSYAVICIAIILDDTDLFSLARERFSSNLKAAIYHPDDEHPTLGSGWPWPPSPPPEGAFNQYDSPDDMRKYWYNVIVFVMGMCEETGRDDSHWGMALGPAAMICIVLDNHGIDTTSDDEMGINSFFERMVTAADLFSQVEGQAVVEVWLEHGGSYSALESSSWKPTEWTTFGLSDWKRSGSAADFPMFYFHTWLANHEVEVGAVTWLVERFRVNDPNAGRSMDNLAGNSNPQWGNNMVLPALMFSPF